MEMGKIKLAWHRWGRRLCLAAAGLLALGFLALYLAVWIKSREEDDAVPSDCIVVLGAKAHGLEPGRVLRARLDRARQAYAQGLGGKILVCGGKGTDETVPEAEAMAAYLKAQGVPDEDILLEQDSRNTRENLRFAKRIMEANGYQTCVLVTSDSHMARARLLARQEGLPATGSRAKSEGPGAWLSRVRECLSWIKYALGLSKG